MLVSAKGYYKYVTKDTWRQTENHNIILLKYLFGCRRFHYILTVIYEKNFQRLSFRFFKIFNEQLGPLLYIMWYKLPEKLENEKFLLFVMIYDF